ncbi:MAG: hypothetical protein IPL70_03200, partial [Uliginosibacterium sp.]|nr:hypothetical protein [Uliginosibacterium sp.]
MAQAPLDGGFTGKFYAARQRMATHAFVTPGVWHFLVVKLPSSGFSPAERIPHLSAAWLYQRDESWS